MIKQHGLLVSTILLILVYVVNYLSSSGMLGNGMMQLREIFPFPYMPAGWTFAVAWTSIYVAVGARCVRSRLPAHTNDATNQRIFPLFIISCLLNIGWILLTASEAYLFSVVVIILLMVVLIKILASIYKGPHATLQRLAFGLYTGWIIMASMVVALSQAIYIMYPNIPLTERRTIGIIVRGVTRAVWCFVRYRNRGQLIITGVALAGIASSIGIF